MSVHRETTVRCDNNECTNNLPFEGIPEGHALLYAKSTYNWVEQPNGDLYCPDCDEKTNPRIRFGSSNDEKDEGTKCQSCGHRYKVDIILPDELWNEITDKNLLCGHCIVSKLEEKGFGVHYVAEEPKMFIRDIRSEETLKEGVMVYRYTDSEIHSMFENIKNGERIKYKNQLEGLVKHITFKKSSFELQDSAVTPSPNPYQQLRDARREELEWVLDILNPIVKKLTEQIENN